MIEVDEDDFVPVDDVAKIQPDETCGDCSLRGACPGLYRGYYEAYGDERAAPRDEPRRARTRTTSCPSATSRAPPARLAPCADDGVRARTIAGGPCSCASRIGCASSAPRRATSPTRSSSRSRRTSGRSTSTSRPSSRPTTSRAICASSRVAAECAACRERRAMHRLLRARAARTSSRATTRACSSGSRASPDACSISAAARARTSTCSRRALGSGAIEYVGVDPDPGRLPCSPSRYPSARFVVGPRGGSRPTTSAPSITCSCCAATTTSATRRARSTPRSGASRPGGTLTVVDNVAFGLVRSRAHAARAEARPRTASSTTATTTPTRGRASGSSAHAPLRLLERRDVGRGTSNQWLLRYERVEQVSP